MRRACFKNTVRAVERFFQNPAYLRALEGAAEEATPVTAAAKAAGWRGGWDTQTSFVGGMGWVACVLTLMMAVSVPTLHAQGPALTTISDTVYRADGSPASGMALISWPSFQTAEGDALTAGNQSVTIGTGGAFTTQLVPNAGASPVGTLYVVVFQLDDGTVRTEYWSVPTTSPTTIAAVRTTPGTGLGNSVATQQYVNAAVSNRALDSTVVHLAGSETITGTKQFAVPPSLPQPVGSSDAANKSYVDAAVSNVGSGSYVLKAGDTMSGPLTLPGEPGRMRLAEDRITALERNDIKRNVYDRIVTAAIAFAVSALITLHDRVLPK
jgi:hypothetical protein